MTAYPRIINKIHKNQTMKTASIFLILLLLSGCYSTSTKNKAELVAEEIVLKPMLEYGSISIVCGAYYAKNKRWPLTIDELEGFLATKEKEPPFDIDLTKYTNVDFESLEDGSLKVAYEARNHPSLNTRMSMVIHPPGADGNLSISMKFEE